MNLIEVALLVVAAIIVVLAVPLALGMLIGRAIHAMAGEEEGPIFESDDHLASLAEFSNYSRLSHPDDALRRRQLKNLAGLIVVKH